MSAPPPSSRGASAAPIVVNWLPDASAAAVWSVFGIAVTVVGLPLFALPSLLRAGPSGVTGRFGLGDVLLVMALTVILLIAHEAIHGLVMIGFGARPRFGATMAARTIPALFTTCEGHRFSRGQYLAVAVTPAVIISALGYAACFGPWTGYRIVPLAFHLGGCVGDGFASWRVLREPPGTECEDLRDGIRFHRLGFSAT